VADKTILALCPYNWCGSN